jgi:hypothetical protein
MPSIFSELRRDRGVIREGATGEPVASVRVAMRRVVRIAVAGLAVLLSGAAVAPAAGITVHVQRSPVVSGNLHVRFRASRLPEDGYYYAVIVLRPYRRYTRRSPPPCSTSSDMQRTDYGHPGSGETVALALAPASSTTGRWCPGGTYAGAIYAVPHAPPCNSTYPCRSEEYERPCAGVAPGCVEGVVAIPKSYAYPEGLPAPRAVGTEVVARFSVKFPAHSRRARRARPSRRRAV